MVFARSLRTAGDEFRSKFLNSTDISDGTILPLDNPNFGPGSHWLHRFKSQSVFGGPYLSVHWRRGDYAYSPADPRSPGAREAANQILDSLHKFNIHHSSDPINSIYLATDATQLGQLV